MTEQVVADRPDQTQRLPLFYKQPQLLHSTTHAGWRLQDGDAAFATETPYVPIVIGEMVAAARDYPVVFAGDDAQPLAVLGLEKRNLFVEGGRWRAHAYIPAYVRRYPFAFVATSDPEGFALAIDVASGRVAESGEEGAALFEDSKPSALTRQALDFCGAFQKDIAATRAFADALKAEDLLIDRRADATLPDGRKLGIDGFRVVDAEKFAKLSDQTALDWHHKGWLALVQFHLASLDRFRTLLSLQADVATSQDDAFSASSQENPRDNADKASQS